MNIGFLASHGGSNMQAIIEACKSGKLQATPAVVISNNSNSGAIARAKTEGVPYYYLSGKTHPGPGDLDDAILDAFLRHSVDVVVLAGYMKKLGPKLLSRFRGRIVNIHPALLPKFGGEGMYGIHVHEAVIAAGEKESGITIHFVDEQYDTGKILAQTRVPVKPDDTPETLAARVLEQEHILYAETLQRIVTGEIPFPT
jgi:phosphoribosylglycinamide formyltransferase-1